MAGACLVLGELNSSGLDISGLGVKVARPSQGPFCGRVQNVVFLLNAKSGVLLCYTLHHSGACRPVIEHANADACDSAVGRKSMHQDKH